MDKLTKKYDRNPVKCEIETLKPIKIILDDVLCQFLRTEMKYVQSTCITDVRIVIGLICTLLAAYQTYLSLYAEFKDYMKSGIKIVAAYFILNFILEIIMRIFNKNSVFRGKNGNEKIEVYTSLKSPDTNYVVMVYKNGKVIPEKYNKDVCSLFDVSGTLLHNVYFNDLQVFMNENKKEK